MQEYEILRKEVVSDDIKIFELYAPLVARYCDPGQFLIVMVHEEGERIPLTIADFDREKGTVEIVFQEVGKSTMHLGTLEPGQALYAIVGPFGHKSDIQDKNRVITIGGGIGIAPVYPIARGYKQHGAEVINIIGARTQSLLVYEDKMREISDELIVCTDDGSYGRKGVVTEPLKEVLDKDPNFDVCLAIGPAIMMKFVAEATKPYGIKTIVSLNSVMVDGTGMCGGCRVDVGGETFYTCVDGPEFDAHKVDFDLLMTRQSTYQEHEKQALERWKHKCRLESAQPNIPQE